MYVMNELYMLLRIGDDGTAVLRNVATGREIRRLLLVDLNDGKIRVGEIAPAEGDPPH